MALHARLTIKAQPKEVPSASFLKEIRAGVTTFATMAYIIAVNAAILSQTGGTCDCPEKSPDICAKNQAYVDCKEGKMSRRRLRPDLSHGADATNDRGQKRPNHGHGRHRWPLQLHLRLLDKPPCRSGVRFHPFVANGSWSPSC
jgi:hypothetical protein